MKERTRYQEANLAFLLLAGLLAIWAIGSHVTRSTLTSTVYIYVNLMAWPLLSWLLGREIRCVERTKDTLTRTIWGLLGLYVVQKVLIFCVKLIIGKSGSLNFLNDDNTAWLYLCGAVWLALAFLIERRGWKHGPVLAVSVALGCVAGYLPVVEDLLCLSKLFVFAPLFLVGFWGLPDRLKEFLNRAWVRVLSLVVVLAVVGGCLVAFGPLYNSVGFLTAADAYASLGNTWLNTFGGLFRLAWYGVIAVVGAALLSVMPRRKLPLLTLCGKRWFSVYFWLRPLTYFLFARVVNVLMESGQLGEIDAVLICLALLPVLSLHSLETAAKGIFHWYDRAKALPKRFDHRGRKTDAKERGFFRMAHRKRLTGRDAGWGRFYLLYTVLFLAVALLVFAPFIHSDKSLVWSNDGLYQRYNIFVYIGSYMRTVFKNLVFNHTLEIPMWEFSIGYGADAITYLFGDPFDFFSFFVPTAYAEYAYSALIVLRVYLAGIAISCFCRKMDCQRFPTLCGMFVYAFCSFSITSCVRQPYFLNPMIYLPLILLGVEKILRKESPVTFILFVALAAFSSFYFFYMIVLLTILYVAFRLFSFVKEHRVRNFLYHVLRLGGYAVIGLAIVAVLFIPKAYLYLGDTRTDTDYEVKLFYSLKEYSTMLGSYVNNGEPILWGRIGQSPIVLLGIGGLFLQKKKDGWLKGLFLLMTAFLLFPVAGYVFNGFGYTTNRWVFGYSFLCAFILVKQLPGLMNLSTKKKAALSVGCCVYAAACILMAYSRTESAMLGCVILFCSLLFLIWIPQLRTIQWKRLVIRSRRIAQIGVFALAIAGVLALSFYRYSFTEMDFVGEFIDSGKVLSTALNNRSKAWELIDDDSFYRIDETSSGGPSNYLLSSGQSTTVQYWSLTNTGMSEYFALNSATSGKNYAIKGLLSRSLLAPFASAKYFTCNDGQESYVPYGYTLLGNSGKYQVYESDLSLPLGYTCSTVVSYEDYVEELSAVERQEAMLQGAVVSEEETEVYQTLETAEVTYANRSLDYELEYDPSEIEESESGFLVKSADATITLTFDCPADSELYVYLSDLTFQSISSYDLRTEEEWESYSTYDKNVADWKHRYATENTSASVKASSNGVSASASCYTKHNIYTNGRTEYLLNLCYSEEGRTTLTLTFSATGLYTFDSMSVVAQPMEGVAEYLSAMKEDVLENEAVETNRITGTISLDEAKLLCLSVPYSEGWTAYVDGEEAELIRTNVMYMGLLLDAGEHTIELRYTTPYLKLGAVVNCVGVAALIICCVVRRRRQKAAAVEQSSDHKQN